MTSTQSTSAAATRAEEGLVARIRSADPAEQAFMVLRAAFTVAPILFGLDKFFHLMVNWDRYLAPVLSAPVPFTPHQLMYAVGVTEIIAGVVVAIHPRLGGPVVAAWLFGILVNLLSLGCVDLHPKASGALFKRGDLGFSPPPGYPIVLG